MDIVILSAGKPHKIAPALLWKDVEAYVRNWQQNFFNSIEKRALFVVSDKEIPRTSGSTLIINEDAENSGSAESLVLAVESGVLEDSFFACYGDVLFETRLLSKLEAKDGDVVFAVDFSNPARNEGAHFTIPREVALFEGGDIQSFKRLWPSEKLQSTLAVGEFVGVVLFRKNAKNWLNNKALNRSAKNEPLEISVSELLDMMVRDGLNVNGVRSTNMWAEIRDSRDVSRYFLRGKSESLNRISKNIRLSKVPKFVTFSRSEWVSSKELCVAKATDLGNGSLVVVRSSSSKEDGFYSSNAGAFASILDVSSSDEDALYKAIDRVFSSFPGDDSEGDVIVQIQVQEIVLSGVIFTRGLATGSPYVFISFDDESGRSDSVTSGREANIKTMVLARNIESDSLLPAEMGKIHSASKEIEKLVGFDALDIEFALDSKGVIWTLQVRPLIVSKNSVEGNDIGIFNAIRDTAKSFDRLASRFSRSIPPLFGLMPDWNPAEIIGVKPKPLSVGLYRRLITDDVWAAARHEDGYRDLRQTELMAVLGGSPYVDVRASFFSFIPKNIDAELSEKFVSAAVKRLINNPTKHDKVEFEILPTCFSLDKDFWFGKLTEDGFSEHEINLLFCGLKQVTIEAISSTTELIMDLEYFRSTFDSWVPTEDGLEDFLDLIKLCSSGPTLNFSRLARRGFIAASFLKSSVENEVISESERLHYLQSIETVSTRFASDISKVALGNGDFSQLVENYGHLRPGTYDITKKSYSENPVEILGSLVESARLRPTESHATPDSHASEVPKKVSKALSEIGLVISPTSLDQFIREATFGREESKFVFTKYLSRGLSRLADWGLRHNLGAEDLSFFELPWIEGALPSTKWLSRAEENRLTFLLESLIEPPSLVSSPADFQFFTKFQATPNFVGSTMASASGFLLNGEVKIEYLRGKIVLIENADPGYEWIFGTDIKGLVTMFGGGNSHMAVRCSELNIPAAIGVGDELFRKASRGANIILDPVNRKLDFE